MESAYQSQGSYWKKGRKAVRVRGNGLHHGTRTVQKWQADACMNSQKLWQHIQDLTGLYQPNPAWRREVDTKSHSWPRSYLQGIPAGKENVVFSNAVSTDISPCMYPYSLIVGLHKMLIFCVCLCVLFHFVIFVSYWDFYLFFLLLFIFLESEKRWSWYIKIWSKYIVRKIFYNINIACVTNVGF